MDTLHVLVVDDESLARARLRELLRTLGITHILEAGTAEIALKIVEDHEVDLVLLDIQMPGQNGLAVAANLRNTPQPPAVVFVTAHDQHALEAFNLAAVDYLTKPVRLERLRVAVDRVRFHYLNRPQPNLQEALDSSNALLISERQGTRRLPIQDVLYFKAEQKYVTVKTAKASFLIEDSLNSLQDRWSATFIRIHRNALVARRLIQGMHRGTNDSWELELQMVPERLEVSRRNVAEVRHLIHTGTSAIKENPN